LNLKKDGETLSGPDEAFMHEIIKNHSQSATKLKDFQAFEVGQHPDFAKTRCFFVKRNDGTLEDFSVTKCIMNLENKAPEE
jgi:hypothetical protein